MFERTDVDKPFPPPTSAPEDKKTMVITLFLRFLSFGMSFLFFYLARQGLQVNDMTQLLSQFLFALFSVLCIGFFILALLAGKLVRGVWKNLVLLVFLFG